MGKRYIRKDLFSKLWKVLKGPINLIQVVVGPRQVGKTTLALQIFDKWSGPKIYGTADQPAISSLEWIASQWEKARILQKEQKQDILLILDEIQKIPKWSELVKKLYDEDRRRKYKIRVILLGSSALLVQKGLSESLAGRFELHRHNQWSLKECQECFGLSFEEYVYFGGYPGALTIREDEIRWAKYIRDSLIETVLAKDVLLMTPVTKPALLRQTFGLSVTHPAQILSYQKMLGTLQDAGNTTTIASYLKLLSNAFLVVPIERWSGSKIRQRGSIPKIIVLDNALVSAMLGNSFQETLNNRVLWGRFIENLVGARLYMLMSDLGGEVFYWQERQNEIDYVIRRGTNIIAIEVKSGIPDKKPSAFTIFDRKYRPTGKVVISPMETDEIDSIKNIKIEDFFKQPEKILGKMGSNL